MIDAIITVHIPESSKKLVLNSTKELLTSGDSFSSDIMSSLQNKQLPVTLIPGKYYSITVAKHGSPQEAGDVLINDYCRFTDVIKLLAAGNLKYLDIDEAVPMIEDNNISWSDCCPVESDSGESGYGEAEHNYLWENGNWSYWNPVAGAGFVS